MAKHELNVAVVQFESLDGKVEENLVTAERWLRKAAEAGAELVLFAEFMSIGYDMSTAIWDCAEALDGPTTRWLRAVCHRYGVWAGTTILETNGKDMVNTFVLVDSDGEISGTARKSWPAAAEAYRFRGVSDGHVINTPFGRIGIGICYESLFRTWAKELAAARPDFVLLSFSGPVPTPSRFNPPENSRQFVKLLEQAPANIAQLLGVPVAYANKTGSWRTKMPWPLPDEDSYFPGSSRIVDGRGQTLAVLGDEPGFAVSTIEAGCPGKPTTGLPKAGRWNQKVPRFFRMFRIPELIGKLHYRLSLKRRLAARRRLHDDHRHQVARQQRPRQKGCDGLVKRAGEKR